MSEKKDINTTTSLPSREGQGGSDILDKVVDLLKTVYDPEIPVNIYDLGLIYRIELTDASDETGDEQGASEAKEEKVLAVDMTLTAPNCPAADFIMEDVRQKLETIEGLSRVDVNLVFEPEWDKDMMSEEAKLELGMM
ncbi:MAG: DUF59 domain-containing protein [Bacteroidaceae bacterium]|nr:DUF59 domain-containing protein [Bacteroidaceae bacterium]